MAINIGIGTLTVNFEEDIANRFFRVHIPKTEIDPKSNLFKLTKENGEMLTFNTDVSNDKYAIFAIKGSFPKGENKILVSLTSEDYNNPAGVGYEYYRNFQKGVPADMKSVNVVSTSYLPVPYKFDENEKGIYVTSQYSETQGSENFLVDYNAPLKNFVNKKIEVIGKDREVVNYEIMNKKGGMYSFVGYMEEDDYLIWNYSEVPLRRGSGENEARLGYIDPPLYNWLNPPRDKIYDEEIVISEIDPNIEAGLWQKTVTGFTDLRFGSDKGTNLLESSNQVIIYITESDVNTNPDALGLGLIAYPNGSGGGAIQVRDFLDNDIIMTEIDDGFNELNNIQFSLYTENGKDYRVGLIVGKIGEQPIFTGNGEYTAEDTLNLAWLVTDQIPTTIDYHEEEIAPYFEEDEVEWWNIWCAGLQIREPQLDPESGENYYKYKLTGSYTVFNPDSSQYKAVQKSDDLEEYYQWYLDRYWLNRLLSVGHMYNQSIFYSLIVREFQDEIKVNAEWKFGIVPPVIQTGYLAYEEYNQMLPNYPMSDNEFNEFETYAEEDIAGVLHMDLSKIHESQSACVKKAIAYQTLFNKIKGGLDKRNETYYDWMMLDGYSYRYRKEGSAVKINNVDISERAVQSLNNCGLLYAGSRGFY